MSMMSLSWAGTAGTTNNNLASGEKFEFLSRPSVVKLYLACDASAGSVTADFSLGNVVVGDNLVPRYVTAGSGPNRNEHLLLRAVGRAGDRIQLRLRETGGATATPTRAMIEIDEIA